MNGISLLLLIIFILFLMQAIGGYFQIQDYRKAIKRVHQLGNVGVGQKKGRLLSGNIVMIACDGQGVIKGAEIMEGLSFLTKFKPVDSFLGRPMIGTTIYDFLKEIEGFDKKKKKYYKGYIRALEALDMRLQGITL